MENKQYIVDKIEAAQSCCIDLATGKGSYEEYEEARSALLSEPLMHSHIPECERLWGRPLHLQICEALGMPFTFTGLKL